MAMEKSGRKKKLVEGSEKGIVLSEKMYTFPVSEQLLLQLFYLLGEDLQF